MYESTSTEVTGERNIESGKLPFRKEVGQQFPHGMSLSVFLPTLTKKLLVDNLILRLESFLSGT